MYLKQIRLSFILAIVSPQREEKGVGHLTFQMNLSGGKADILMGTVWESTGSDRRVFTSAVVEVFEE